MGSIADLLERMEAPDLVEVSPPTQEQKQRLRVWQAFNKYGIKPFTNESVERYKNAVTEQAYQSRNSLGNLLKRAFFPLLLIGASCLLGVLFRSPVWFVVAAAATFGTLYTLATVQYVGSWEEANARFYRGYIPTRVTLLGAALVEPLPGVQFRVHEFVERDVVLDPFFSIIWGRQEYFVAVWDERGFDPTQNA